MCGALRCPQLHPHINSLTEIGLGPTLVGVLRMVWAPHGGWGPDMPPSPHMVPTRLRSNLAMALDRYSLQLGLFFVYLMPCMVMAALCDTIHPPTLWVPSF